MSADPPGRGGMAEAGGARFNIRLRCRTCGAARFRLERVHALMPITYSIDSRRRIVWATASGRLSDQDVLAYQVAAWEQADTAGYDELVDLTAVTQVEMVSPEKLAELAQRASQSDSRQHPGRLAIVGTSDLHFGVGRMYQTHRSLVPGGNKEVRVFRQREEALIWLGLE